MRAAEQTSCEAEPGTSVNISQDDDLTRVLADYMAEVELHLVEEFAG
jgi:hypothetical protein